MTTKTTYNLTNINLMSQEQFSNLEEISDNELYAVDGCFVTDYNVEGNEWYRKWSNGFIEQGGITESASSVTFHVAFGTALYNATLTPVEQTSTVPYINARYTTLMIIAPTGIPMLWMARGY